MHSKWTPWEYFKLYSKSIDKNVGFYSLLTFDPFITKIFLDKLPRKEYNIRTVHSSDVSTDWLENNFCTLSFFGNSESYLIQNAESLSPSVKDFLLETSIDLSDRLLILSFIKDCDLRKKIVSKYKETHIHIVAPPFWEMGKLLDFLADHLDIRLSYESKTFLLNSIPHTCSEFWMALNILKLNYPNQVEISFSDTESLIKNSRLDSFQLASLFSSKKRAQFLDKLLKIDNNFEELRGFFSFMQSHLLKIYDTSYINTKPRASKYDKEIMTQSRLWTSKELLDEIRKFGEYEILAKQKSEKLQINLKRDYLKAMSL